jgi:hypothetical protein
MKVNKLLKTILDDGTTKIHHALFEEERRLITDPFFAASANLNFSKPAPHFCTGGSLLILSH